eukprot:5910706-Pleurochrysis_carterae.AAC.1
MSVSKAVGNSASARARSTICKAAAAGQGGCGSARRRWERCDSRRQTDMHERASRANTARAIAR